MTQGNDTKEIKKGLHKEIAQSEDAKDETKWWHKVMKHSDDKMWWFKVMTKSDYTRWWQKVMTQKDDKN